MDGIDAAHKTALLAANAFGMPVRFDRAHVEGIRGVDALDVAAAREWGHAVKLLGIARGQGESVELRVHLPRAGGGAMNAVMLRGDAQGIALHYGAGAGAEPTASAVVADLVDLARQTVAQAGGPVRCTVPPLGVPVAAWVDRPVLCMDDVVTRHYLRVPLREDAEGIAPAALAQWLAQAGVVVERLDAWRPRGHGSDQAQLLALTRPARDGAVRDVLQRAAQADWCLGAPAHLRVENLE